MGRVTDRTAEAIALLKIMAAEANVDVKTLRDKGLRARALAYTRIRRRYCERGRAEGFTTLELGIALNRDHTTISYHANPAIRARKQMTRTRGVSRAELRQRRERKTAVNSAQGCFT